MPARRGKPGFEGLAAGQIMLVSRPFPARPGPRSGEDAIVRQRVAAIVNSDTFQHAILAVIFFNGVILALDAIPAVAEDTRRLLRRVDQIVVWVFVVEIALRIYANGRSFFRDGWSIFDFVVVAISIPGTMTGITALRILRALRLLRILSGVPQLRKVGEALVAAVPGIAWVGALLLLINVIAAIIGTNLFGEEVPEYFGDLFTSMYTLFMVMTLEDWPDVAAAVMAAYPLGWIYFVIFILVATFTMLNLFVGVIVSVMEHETSSYRQWEKQYRAQLRTDIDTLNAQVATLVAKIDEMAGYQNASAQKPRDDDKPGGV
jgi:voltage-gated sodium channel